MAEINKAIKVGDIYTNLVEPSTGKSVNYQIVTEWYDGTPMDDSKADGDLYRKVGTDYVRKVIDKDGELFLEKDSMDEMRNLSSLEILMLKAGVYKGVTLNGYYEKGDTPAPIDYFLSDTEEDDDGGSVVEVGGIKLEHDFQKGVNTKYFGTYKNNPENTSIINKIIEYLTDKENKELINEQHLKVTLSETPNRYSGCIELRDEVIFNNKNGVIELSPTNEPEYSIIGADNIKGVTVVVGKIIGDRDWNTSESGEWGMGIGFRDVSNFVIKDGGISNCWGDGIYLAGDSSEPSFITDGCVDGRIDNVIVDNVRRNGASLVASKNVTITNSVFKNTNGTMPEAGIDLEPNTNQRVSNITINKCYFHDNNGMNISITSHSSPSENRFAGIVEDVLITDCVIEKDYIHISQSSSYTENVVRRIKIDNCKITTQGEYGINVINGVNYVNIINSTIRSNGNTGVRFYKSDYCTIQSSDIKTTSSHICITIQEGSSFCEVVGCKITPSQTWGISVQTGVYNKIYNNTIKGGGEGIISYGNGTSITDNIIQVANRGIRLNNIEDAVIKGNKIKSTGDSSASMVSVLDKAVNVSVLNNSIEGNELSTYLLEITGSSNKNVRVSENNLYEGVNGIRITSGRHKINNNILENLSGRAIWVNGSNSVIEGNTLLDIGNSSIEASGYADSKILNNIIRKSGTGYNNNSGRVMYIRGNTVNSEISNNYIDNSENTNNLSYAIEMEVSTVINNFVKDNKIKGSFSNEIRNEINNHVVKDSTASATISTLGLTLKAGSVSDTTATDVEGLVSDFNSLLAKLRTAGLLEE